MAAQPRPQLVQPEDESIKLIALTKGQVAIVDADKYEWAMQWNWHARFNPDIGTYYAVRNGRREGKRLGVYLHRQLLGEPEGEVDHWNGKTLDCRISNLRVCTPAQNRANQGPRVNNTSGYPGVNSENGKWRARIQAQRGRIHLGYFDFQSDAITARELAEERYFKEFAYSARQDQHAIK